MWSVALESLCKDTIWRPYFDIVPARFNLPISWNAEDRELFAGTEIADMIGDPEADFKSQFLPFASQFDLTAGLSEERLRELYFYSGSLVSSYSFTDEDGQISMVPLADILNHKTGFHNASLFFERNHLQMVAIKNVPAGSQLYNTYGDLGNEELLFRYGYIDDPNPFTVVKIPIEQVAA